MKKILLRTIPQLEVLNPDWLRFLKETLESLYAICPDEASYTEVLLDFQEQFPQWAVQKEQLADLLAVHVFLRSRL